VLADASSVQTWLFDAGEGTQRQLALCRTCDLSSSRLSRIFISHMHGDHVRATAIIATARST